MMKKFTLLILLISFKAISCEFDTPRSFSLFTSLKNQRTHAFDTNKTLYDIPIMRAFNCKKLALRNQYLMIGQGPEVVEYDDQVRSYSFSDEFYPSQCTIKDSPVAIMSFEDKLEIFKAKKKYMNSCLDIYIEDEGRMPLRITEEQPGCKVEKLTTHKARISGGFCFVKPTVTSSYLIKIKVKKECQTKAGLRNINISPGDIKGTVNYYAAGDQTGTSSSLSALSTTPVRLITNSDENVIPSSESYGEINPQFPAYYMNPALLPGMMSIRDYGPNYKLETPFMVDNRCDDKCVDGLCYSSCRYAQPVAYEVELHGMGKKRMEILTSWYDGGVAQPGFQGFIRGNGFEVPKSYLEHGKKYKLIFTFHDPKFDFEKLKDRIVRRFGEIRQNLPQMNRNAISEIPEINEILSIMDLPDIREIHGIDFSNGLRDLKDSIALLRSYLGYKLWPPYFEMICNQNESQCVNLARANLKVEIDFEMGTNANEEPEMKVLSVKRNSIVDGIKTYNKLPYLKCGYDL